MADLVFYDGTCGFCHANARFIVNRDPKGHFSFAPYGGVTYQTRLSDQPSNLLPSSVLVLTEQGELKERSDAAIHILKRLGGGYAWLGGLAAWCPRGVRNVLYGALARTRHRIMPRPPGACPLMPVHLRDRFLD